MTTTAGDWAAIDTAPTMAVADAEALVSFAEIVRTRATVRPGSPMELARRLDPNFRYTAAIRAISDVAVRSVTEPDQRDVVTTPPRTGKSNLLAIHTPAWAFMRNPDLQIVIICHSDDLAQDHSRKTRELIKEHSDFLGYRIAQDKTAVGRWKVEGRKGGMLAAGINSGVVGFGADLMVIDDPVKDAAQADSVAHRKRVLGEYQGALATRIHPGGSALIVMTRWHEEDLAGSLLKQEPDRWVRTNIPCVSEVGVPDILGRPTGQTMTSALGYTPDHFAALRRTVGERVWYAQFQGVPSAPEGGLVKRDWLNDWRLPIAPPRPVSTIVGVDPADSGQGDSCGIVAASISRDGVTAVIADKSAPMTSDAWAKTAVQLAVDVGASQIAVESFAAGETYRRVVREAIAAAKPPHPIKVTAWPPKGSGRGRGDAMARSAALLQGLETGTVRIAGQLPQFEDKAVLWQAGQHQPDCVAALVVAHDELIHSIGREWQFAAPGAGSGSVSSLGWARQRLG